MPIKIPASLPANSVLQRENIFVMDEERADHQDIRPLKIAILNLMPKKVETETGYRAAASSVAVQYAAADRSGAASDEISRFQKYGRRSPVPVL